MLGIILKQLNLKQLETVLEVKQEILRTQYILIDITGPINNNKCKKRYLSNLIQFEYNCIQYQVIFILRFALLSHCQDSSPWICFSVFPLRVSITRRIKYQFYEDALNEHLVTT